jgi:hypothetical protein
MACHQENNLINYDLKGLGASIKIPNSFVPVSKKDIGLFFTKKERDGESRTISLAQWCLSSCI